MAATLWFSILLILLGTATPLLACSVCGYASEASRTAFIVTTGLLTFVPLLFVGGVLWYLKKKSRTPRL